MSQFLEAFMSWCHPLCWAYTTVLIGMLLIDRVPRRPFLLLIPFAADYAVRELRKYFYRVYITYLLPKHPVPPVIPLASILIITFSLIICLGFPDQEPQLTESQTAHPAAPSSDSQDRQKDGDNSRDCSKVTTSSDIPLENSTCKAPTYTLFKVLERLCNYRMAAIVRCISMVSKNLPQDIYLLGRPYQDSYDTFFLVSGTGDVKFHVDAICRVNSYWLILIFVSYPIRWFVLPLLYFLVAVMYAAFTDVTVCDRAIALAHWAEEGTEWSSATAFFGWLRDWMARRNASRE